MAKILIIEDEKMLREMYVQKFSQAGFEVLSSDEASKGVRIAKKEKPDLVLLDILLPKKNGLDFLEKIRKDPKTSETKVVAFSNYDDPQVKKDAIELGVKAYLIKTSFTPAQIVEEIKAYID